MIVYKVVNKKTGKIYIGKTKQTLHKRLDDHFKDASRGSPAYFHRAIRKYGKHNFIARIIARTEEVTTLNKLEKQFISRFNSSNFKIGYNETLGGDGVIPNDKVRLKLSKSHLGKVSGNKGHKFSIELKKRLSDAHKGKKHSMETRLKMSQSQTGKKLSNEHKRKIRNTLKGREITKEWRLKISNTLKGNKPWNKGIRLKDDKYKT